MIIFVRHGERADQSGNKKEKEQIQKYFDPHLTEVGGMQARQTGLHLKQVILDYAKNNNIKIEDLQINFMTSPFLRCIQTSINLMREIPNNQKLYIQDEIAEWMSTFDFDKEIQKDLHIRTKLHPNFNQEYQNGVQILHQKFFSTVNLKQAVYPESPQMCYKRVNLFLQELVNQMNKDPKKANIINICVTHQGLLEFVLQGTNSNYEYVDYCGVAQFVLEGNNKIKVQINGKSFWK